MDPYAIKMDWGGGGGKITTNPKNEAKTFRFDGLSSSEVDVPPTKKQEFRKGLLYICMKRID